MAVASEWKKCAKCQADKWLKDFGDDARATDGKQSYCHACMREYNRLSALKHQRANPEQYNAYMKEYRQRRKQTPFPVDTPRRLLSDL